MLYAHLSSLESLPEDIWDLGRGEAVASTIAPSPFAPASCMCVINAVMPLIQEIKNTLVKRRKKKLDGPEDQQARDLAKAFFDAADQKTFGGRKKRKA